MTSPEIERLAEGGEHGVPPDPHSGVQRAVVEQFTPRFAPGSLVLYLGNTAEKDGLVLDAAALADLGIASTEHDRLPDILTHDEARNRLFLVDIVTSQGPMSRKRIVELEAVFAKCNAPRIYVTAFADRDEFCEYLLDIAWGTEVWLCDAPDHMIHFNGDRFLGR